jgi:hypothetical protein
MIAAHQCVELSHDLNSLSIENSNEHDKWVFPWGGDRYSAKKVYMALLNAPDAPPPFKWI